MEEQKFMLAALKEAQKACIENEVPIGAVIVQNGKIIARAHNKRNSNKIATHHAEVLAIEKACKKLRDWRLENAEIFVTLEPCPMCAGAIANARIKRLVFGAFDTAGTNKNLLENILTDTRLNHKTQILGGVLEEDCQKILQDFFRAKREKSK